MPTCGRLKSALTQNQVSCLFNSPGAALLLFGPLPLTPRPLPICRTSTYCVGQTPTKKSDFVLQTQAPKSGILLTNAR